MVSHINSQKMINELMVKMFSEEMMLYCHGSSPWVRSKLEDPRSLQNFCFNYRYPDQLNQVTDTNGQKMTNELMMAIFSEEEMAKSSLSGQASNKTLGKDMVQAKRNL